MGMTELTPQDKQRIEQEAENTAVYKRLKESTENVSDIIWREGYITGATAEALRDKWIPVSERLPETGDEYNVVWKPDAEGAVVTTMEYDAINKKFIDKAGFCESDCTNEITHWQELPELPPNPQSV